MKNISRLLSLTAFFFAVASTHASVVVKTPVASPAAKPIVNVLDDDEDGEETFLVGVTDDDEDGEETF